VLHLRWCRSLGDEKGLGGGDLHPGVEPGQLTLGLVLAVLGYLEEGVVAGTLGCLGDE
jgi:hypothetical protein